MTANRRIADLPGMVPDDDIVFEADHGDRV
jgi:hypothetical protein